MTNRTKTLFFITMFTALGCGFLHHIPFDIDLNFERLHIFLFNLCTGGTLILYFTENEPLVTRKTWLFYFLSLAFAIFSFLEIYLPTLFIPLFLAMIVESVRVKKYHHVFPKSIFQRDESIAEKFHQASLLCLSLGLIISSLAIPNEIYLQILTIPKLTLNTFFLGYSFPVSLISLSIIFTLMDDVRTVGRDRMKSITFWVINLGVIIFFLFILAGLIALQVAISLALFGAVTLVLYLYYHDGAKLQQKAFLTSGIFFLLITSVTGIIYILYVFSASYSPENTRFILRLHAFTALYGWNLSGLVVIIRYRDFPLRLHSGSNIFLHWLTVFILCPIGFFLPYLSIAALGCYGLLIFNLLFNYGTIDRKLVNWNQ